jgi:hypothetical protein
LVRLFFTRRRKGALFWSIRNGIFVAGKGFRRDFNRQYWSIRSGRAGREVRGWKVLSPYIPNYNMSVKEVLIIKKLETADV